MGSSICRIRRILGAISISAIILPAFLISAQDSALAADLVRVKVKIANVRSGPGTKYKKKWSAPRNYPYMVLKRKGRWIQVRDYEGYKDWIHRNLTDKRPAVIVKEKSADIRKGPGKNHPIAFTSDRGVPYLVLGKRGGWFKVRHADGDEGWISRSQVWGALKVKTKM